MKSKINNFIYWGKHKPVAHVKAGAMFSRDKLFPNYVQEIKEF